MPPAGFEPAIPAGDRPQILALDRWGTGIGYRGSRETKITLHKVRNCQKQRSNFSLHYTSSNMNQIRI